MYVQKIKCKKKRAKKGQEQGVKQHSRENMQLMVMKCITVAGVGGGGRVGRVPPPLHVCVLGGGGVLLIEV